MKDTIFLLISGLIIGVTIGLRLENGAAPAYVVIPAIIAFLYSIVKFHQMFTDLKTLKRSR